MDDRLQVDEDLPHRVLDHGIEVLPLFGQSQIPIGELLCHPAQGQEEGEEPFFQDVPDVEEREERQEKENQGEPPVRLLDLSQNLHLPLHSGVVPFALLLISVPDCGQAPLGPLTKGGPVPSLLGDHLLNLFVSGYLPERFGQSCSVDGLKEFVHLGSRFGGEGCSALGEGEP